MGRKNKKIIEIHLNPNYIREDVGVITYSVEANVWHDEGRVQFLVDRNGIGTPPQHFLIYRDCYVRYNNRQYIKRPFDIGHSLEDACEKAYQHALAEARERIRSEETICREKIDFEDYTGMGREKK